MQRFTAYRKKISQYTTHNEFRRNSDSEPQFEGVIFTDGSVAIRWLTLSGSTSVWKNIEDCLNVHGHPEYATEIVWHDGPAPQCWVDILNKFKETV